jgi:hypothetical protein
VKIPWHAVWEAAGTEAASSKERLPFRRPQQDPDD